LSDVLAMWLSVGCRWSSVAGCCGSYKWLRTLVVSVGDISPLSTQTADHTQRCHRPVTSTTPHCATDTTDTWQNEDWTVCWSQPHEVSASLHSLSSAVETRIHYRQKFDGFNFSAWKSKGCPT